MLSDLLFKNSSFKSYSEIKEKDSRKANKATRQTSFINWEYGGVSLDNHIQTVVEPPLHCVQIFQTLKFEYLNIHDSHDSF